MKTSWQFTTICVAAIGFSAYLVFVNKPEFAYVVVTYILGLWSTPPAPVVPRVNVPKLDVPKPESAVPVDPVTFFASGK